MAYNITFNAINSDDFEVGIYNSNTGVKLVDITIGELFDVSPYGGDPNKPWIPPPNNEYRIYPINDAAIVSATSEPINYTPVFTEAEGYLSGKPVANLSNKDNVIVSVIVQGGAIETIAPYNRVYLVDADKIREFSNVVAKPPETNIDYSDFIIRLISLPFKLDEGLIEVSAPIVLGGLVTDILAPVLNTDLITINLGVISVDGFKNNSLDFSIYEYKLFLPFSDLVIELEPKFILGGGISVVYVLDVYSGDVTVNIYSEVQPEPIKTSKISLGRTIPFKMFNDSLQSNVGAFSGANNGVLTAYIQKIEKVVSDGEYANTVKVEGVLGGYSGFISVDEIEIETKATLGEILDIKSILKSGVYISA